MAISASQAMAATLAGATARVETLVSPRFKPGDRVRMRNLNPPSHTRLPRYIKGKVGVIERDHGVFVYPDTHAAGQGEKPQHVYVVRFSAAELWGPQGGANDELLIDVWDDYMDLVS